EPAAGAPRWAAAALCERPAPPLVEVPGAGSFAASAARVLAARRRTAGPGPAVARLRALAAGRDGAATGPAETFAVAASEYVAAGWVLSAARRLVAGAPGAPGWQARAALAAARPRAAPPPPPALARGAP